MELIKMSIRKNALILVILSLLFKNINCEEQCPELCEEGKWCIHDDDDCSLVVMPQMDDEGNVQFLLKTNDARPQNFWVAVALSRDDKMADASAMICELDDQGQLKNAYLAWIATRHSRPEVIGDPQGLSGFAGSYEDNVLSCSFKREKLTEVPTSEEDPTKTETFDLTKDRYYLLVAKGSIGSTGVLNYHNTKFDYGSLSLTGPVKSLCDLCVDEQNCIYGPSDCTQDCNNCEQLLSYTPDEEGNIDFVLAAKNLDENTWIAAALSYDEKMGNDSVMACHKDDEGQPRGVRMFQNVILENPESPEEAGRDSLPLEDEHLGLSEMSVRDEDGFFECRFTREKVTVIEEHQMTFDLAQDRYNIFLGQGRMKDDTRLDEHDIKPFISRQISLVNAINDELICQGCGTEQGCFVLPAQCYSEGGECSCDTVLAYSQNEDLSVDFSLRKANLGDNTYIAMALSTDQLMGDDAVVGCFRGEHGMPYRSYNEEGNNLPIDDEKEQKDEEEELPPLSNVSFEEQEGVVSCSFTLAPLTIIEDLNNLEFDLSNAFHIFLAEGPIDDEQKRILAKHNEIPAISTEKIDLASKEIIGGGQGSKLVAKLHASLMTVGWLALANFGIFFARYNRQSLAPMQIGGKDVWFRIHQSCMILALLLALVGSVLIVIERGLSPIQRISLENPHSALGLAAMALGLTQPLGALLRPAPDAPGRIYFNVIHRTSGVLAAIAAIATILSAVLNNYLGLDNRAELVSWLIVAVIGVGHVLANINFYIRGARKGDPISGIITITAGVSVAVMAVILVVFYWTT